MRNPSDVDIPALIAIDHVQVAIPPGSEAAARAFYLGALGMGEVDKPASLSGRGGFWARAGGIELHLGVEADFRPARKAHPAFVASDLDALAARIEAAGHAVAWDEALPGRRRFFTHDPAGNRIEIMAARP